jgi:hypothetical protein
MDYYPRVRKPWFSGARLIGMGVVLLIFLVLALLFGLLAIPTWQIRLAGIQASAIAHEDGVCPGDSNDPGDSYSFTYEFRGTKGQHYHVAQDSFCTDVYNDGQRVTIWYVPDDPPRIVTDMQVIMLYVFSAIGLPAMVILLIVFFRLLIPPLLTARSY